MVAAAIAVGIIGIAVGVTVTAVGIIGNHCSW